jgi:tRNA pseudouridine13 synthase
MKLKSKPEDFVVRESWSYPQVPGGGYHVYALDKQKVTTFGAAERIAKHFALPLSAISYCGLKDKQGRTEQLIAIKGEQVSLQEPDLRLRHLGETNRPLSARNVQKNRFAVTVRDLSQKDVDRLPESVAEVNRLGLVNYFDSQRFGHLKHGQGFIAKDLIKGQWEHALHNLIAKPSPLDASHDAKVKAFWRDHWGAWKVRAPLPEDLRTRHILEQLRRKPDDFRAAFLTIEPRYRALILFTYQSYLWNEGVKLLLLDLVPHRDLCQLPYQAGVLLFPRTASPEAIALLREGAFPLLGPDSPPQTGPIGAAVSRSLTREKLSQTQLRVADAPLYFKHENRAISVVPGKLVSGKPQRDELNRGRLRVNLGFTLPSGSYATLLVRRLFWFAVEKKTSGGRNGDER